MLISFFFMGEMFFFKKKEKGGGEGESHCAFQISLGNLLCDLFSQNTLRKFGFSMDRKQEPSQMMLVLAVSWGTSLPPALPLASDCQSQDLPFQATDPA